MSLRPAVFLDRDGTLIEEVSYLDRLDLVSIFPWTADAIRLLNRAGMATVVISNQSGVARGFISEAFLSEVHASLDAKLKAGNARIDRYYYCPHHVDGSVPEFTRRCQCRKPLPGLIDRACKDLGLDPARSWMVGDRWLDMECGRAAGTRTILVKTGNGHREAPNPPEGVRADAILSNLMEAVGWILRASTPH